MPGSTYSSNLKIELMTTGENSGTWGDITNTNLGTALEQAVIGYGTVDYVSDANLTISITNTNAAQPARALVLNVTSTFGSLTATRELVVPTIQKQYIVQNNTTGGQSITVKTSAGTGITVPNGRKAHLYVDGTNVIQMFDFVDINGGAIDGTPIGASSASTGAFSTLNASGATTLDGTVALGNASGDLITVPGTINSNLLFTDATYDIGASGATRPRDMYLSRNLTVGGTLTLAGGVNLNGNVTIGDSSADTLTINSTITSNLLFTDNTYDIGASGATRPRNLFLAGNITAGGNQTLTGTLTVDSTTDTSSATTGSIQTDGGVGIAKGLYVGGSTTLVGTILSNLIFTDGTYDIGASGANRPRSLFLSSSVTVGSLTSGRVTFAGASGLLSDASGLTWDGTNFTATQVRSSGLTSGRVTFAGASGLLSDSANLAWNGSTLAITGALTATTDSSFTSTGALLISKGTTGQQPGSPATGMMRYNTTTNQFEGYSGSSPAWKSIGGSALSNDTSTSSNLYPVFAGATSGTAENLYTSNANYLYKPSTGELQALEMVATNGLIVNSATVSANYTIPSGSNAMSAGPVTVNSGITVTVSSGSVWTVI